MNGQENRSPTYIYILTYLFSPPLERYYPKGSRSLTRLGIATTVGRKENPSRMAETRLGTFAARRIFDPPPFFPIFPLVARALGRKRGELNPLHCSYKSGEAKEGQSGCIKKRGKRARLA